MSWEILWPRRLATVNADIALQRNVQSNPSYVVVNAEGVSEVIEHKFLGDVFYVNEDPAVRAELGLAPNPASASQK